MKLNNKGFGLKQMLLLSAILLLFLLFAAYYIFVLYNNLDDSAAPQYVKLETEIKAAAIKYAAIYDAPNVIDLDTLKAAGFIDLFTDSNDKDCDGYVVVGDKEYKPYIKCEYFKTRGYKENPNSRY